jgi:predicted amidohydrolase
MKITVLQRDIVWAQPAENCQRCSEAIDRNPGADLYVLPEMFSTGFCTNPEGIAESTDSATLAWMKEKAASTGAAIAGSVAVTDGKSYYNRFYFVKPDGSVAHYDKKHLFTYGGEHHRFTAGEERVVVEHCGVRILLEICYDLRFPVWARNRGDYDMILYVASWPTPRVAAWSALLLARAIENQCYVAGVNRVGTDPSCEYCGGTVVIDPYGKTIAECPMGEESEASAVVDMDALEAFRQKFPVLEDRDLMF